MGTVTDNIKRNVRAVLLSKVGGILVSDFPKDYKSLLREQLNFKQLGFQSLTDLIKAMPDVVRLDFSEKDLAYKMFGIMDPNSSYTPLSAKLAAGSSPDEKGDNRRGGRRNNTKSGLVNGDVHVDESGEYAGFEANMRGHYTLCYYRERESSDATKESLEQVYGEFPGLYEVHLIPRLIFVRYTNKGSAIQCLEKYKLELGMKIANEKEPRSQAGGAKRGGDSIMGERRSQNREPRRDDKKKYDGDNEIYIGNLAESVTEDDLNELCAEFSPVDLRLRKKSDNPKKVFAFAKFNDIESAKRCVEKINKMELRGRNIDARLANKDPKPQNIEEPSAPTGGKMPWKAFGSKTAKETPVIEDDEESWDLPNPNKNSAGQSSSGTGVSWKTLLNQDKSQPSNDESSFGSSSFGQTNQNQPSFGSHGINTEKAASSFGQSAQIMPSFGQSAQNMPSLGRGTQSMSTFGQSAPCRSSFGQSEQKSPSIRQTMDNTDQKSSTGWRGTKNDQNDDQGKTGRQRQASSNPTVFFGNLHNSISKEIFEEMVSEFSPLEVRFKVDGPKIFGFVVMSSIDVANSCIEKYNEMDVEGRKMKCHISKSNKPNEGIQGKNGEEETLNGGLSKFSELTVQTDMSTFSRSAASPSARQKTQSPRKPSPNFSQKNQQYKSPTKKVQEDYSGMPSLELQPNINGYSDMPPLEGPDDMPPLEPVNGMEDDDMIKVWVANFPYFVTEDDLMEVYGPLGAVGVHMTNSTNTTRTTGAIVYFLDDETAQGAIAETHQTMYGGRLLWVAIYELDPSKRNHDQGCVNLSISVNTGRAGSRSVSLNAQSLQRSHPEANAEGHNTPTVASNRTFKSLLQTYKIIMNTLGTRVRDVVFKPYEEVMIYITSVFDDSSFWGTVVKDDSSLEALEEVLEQLQNPESRIGYTKGLGRCAALVNDEWQRGWVISSQRNDFTVEVFDVDSGRSTLVKKNHAFLTIPEIWEVLPTVRPFKIQEGTMNVNANMEHALVNVQITSNAADETISKDSSLFHEYKGFLTQVKIMNLVETPDDDD